MKIRAKDIAKMLNLSPAAVSLVMNNKPGVSAQTRRRVLDKLEENGYRHLIDEESQVEKSIDFVVYKRHGNIIMESPFFSLLIENIDLSIRDYGYKLSILHLDKLLMSADDMVQLIRNSSSQGLLIFATEMKEDDMEPILRAGKPFVIIDNYFRQMKVNSVAIDNYYGTNLAAKYLIDMGHKKIGYLKSKVQINSFDQRYEGFLSALRRAGIDGMERFVFEVGYPEANTYSDMKKILESGAELPTALFADNDLIAFGAFRALSEFGFSIPDAISIIGFDNRPVGLLMNPPLTTINVPKGMFGQKAVEILMEQLEGAKGEDNPSEYCVKMEIGTNLIERGSVRRWVPE